MTGINLKYSRVFLPSFDDDLIRCPPSQCLEVFSKVESTDESQHMCFQARQVGVVEGLDRCILDSPVHAFGFPSKAWMGLFLFLGKSEKAIPLSVRTV